ncbi:WhiB family transcriptional regulator [Streptomyces kunmingensis]|uniref:Transcriptional regulator WhiB n=1 Tax=Streptomyces kunmingensis TaxID=68225 RepID=A0ABU6CR30_9ACTN|nr:WhiB family transcriptional regulator [Streptomyces kunmingensis]MEB3967199.1 WhiB family transcriptional regulator [Streptomyces kunmingensis]
MEWLERAACVGEDPELFFPVGSTGPALLDVHEAKAVCERCPVMSECLEYALRTGQTTGVWGGTSETERTPMLRAYRRRARQKAHAG